MRLWAASWLGMAFIVGVSASTGNSRPLGAELNPLVSKTVERKRIFETPTRKLTADEYPFFEDDIDFDWMSLAIDRQLKRFRSKDLRGYIQLGDDLYPLTKVRDSLRDFKQLMAQTHGCMQAAPRQICYRKFNDDLASRFDVFRPRLNKDDPRFGDDKPAFFTGYYTPLLPAKRQPDSQFKYGIYRRPANPALRAKTRQQIDFKSAFEGRGLELFYVPDLFELYLLHVEGGGRVAISEGKNQNKYYLSYDGTNKQPWRFIATYMYDQGMINDMSIASQRKYLLENPHREEEIYSYCPSYVYFKITESPPLGNDSVPLTDRRSMATDTAHYKFKGLLSFVVTERLRENSKEAYRPFSRFFIDQDTGGAIKGKARADLYFGEGEYAERGSANMQHYGQMYFLISKN